MLAKIQSEYIKGINHFEDEVYNTWEVNIKVGVK